MSLGETLSAFGYPAGPPYNGSQLVYCRDEAGIDSVVGSWAIVCDMTGGASGGPWLAETSNAGTTTGCVASVSSYRLTGDDHLFGPELGGATAKVYETARSRHPWTRRGSTITSRLGIVVTRPVHRHLHFDVPRRHRLDVFRGHHHRLLADDVLSDGHRHPRADGRVPRPGLRPAIDRDRLLQRRRDEHLEK